MELLTPEELRRRYPDARLSGDLVTIDAGTQWVDDWNPDATTFSDLMRLKFWPQPAPVEAAVKDPVFMMQVCGAVKA